MGQNSIRFRIMIKIINKLRRLLKGSKINTYVRITISLISLIYLYFKLDWSALELIDDSILLYFISSLPVSALGLFFMAIRWKMLIETILKLKINVIDLYKFYYIANFWGLFLPGSIGGDATRIYNSKEKYDIDLTHATAFVLIERIMGFVAVILIFSLGSMMVSEPKFLAQFNNILYILIITIATSLIFKGKIFKNCSYLVNNKTIFFIICLSMLAQFGDIVIVKLFSSYFNLAITIYHFMVIMPIIYIVSTLPISLGGLGIREGTMVALFSLFGFDASISVVISLLLYFTKIFMGLVGMIIYIKRDS